MAAKIGHAFATISFVMTKCFTLHIYLRFLHKCCYIVCLFVHYPIFINKTASYKFFSSKVGSDTLFHHTVVM